MTPTEAAFLGSLQNPAYTVETRVIPLGLTFDADGMLISDAYTARCLILDGIAIKEYDDTDEEVAEDCRLHNLAHSRYLAEVDQDPEYPDGVPAHVLARLEAAEARWS